MERLVVELLERTEVRKGIVGGFLPVQGSKTRPQRHMEVDTVVPTRILH